jgi:hypothetical protein
MIVCLNPNAKNPLTIGFFEAGETHVMEGERLVPYLQEGHIYSSFTHIVTPSENE